MNGCTRMQITISRLDKIWTGLDSHNLKNRLLVGDDQLAFTLQKATDCLVLFSYTCIALHFTLISGRYSFDLHSLASRLPEFIFLVSQYNPCRRRQIARFFLATLV